MGSEKKKKRKEKEMGSERLNLPKLAHHGAVIGAWKV
jgi:hypothetical protein